MGEPSSSSDPNYSGSFTNLVLCGTSSWVLSQSSFNDGPLMYGAYVFLLGHGILGVVRHSHKTNYDEEIKKVHHYTEIAAVVLPLALFNTEFGLKNDENAIIAYAHTVLSAIPIGVEGIEQDKINNKKLIDFVVAANVCSLGYFAHINEDCLAMVLAAFVAFHHFGARVVSDQFEFDPTEVNAFGLSIFCILSCKVRSTRIC